MLVMRSLDLYEIASLRGGFKSIALSIVACLCCGAVNYLAVKAPGTLDLPFQWLTAWAMFSCFYLVVTRAIAALWTAPGEQIPPKLKTLARRVIRKSGYRFSVRSRANLRFRSRLSLQI
jgi:hypothetical protein